MKLTYMTVGPLVRFVIVLWSLFFRLSGAVSKREYSLSKNQCIKAAIWLVSSMLAYHRVEVQEARLLPRGGAD